MLHHSPKDNLNRWRTLLDEVMPTIHTIVENLWMTDRFIPDNEPVYEFWTVIPYLTCHYPQCGVGSIVLGLEDSEVLTQVSDKLFPLF